MKILFVSSGNSRSGISPVIKSQGESLMISDSTCKLEYFPIKGKGVKGYFNFIPKLRKYLITEEFDIIHAHFSLSAIVAGLAGSRPLVVSLMGTDVNRGRIWNWMNLFFALLFWNKVIVKSMDMYQKLGYKRAEIIPNGVAMDRFKPIPMKEARSKLGWDLNDKIVLFPSDPSRIEKNHKLAKSAVDEIGDVQLLPLIDIPHEHIPLYLNAANVLLLTSIYEGSPNIIKEAMACNCPIISTAVGDVKDVVEGTRGCYIVPFDPKEIANKLRTVLQSPEKTDGRNRIQYLDDKLIAKRIISIYEKILGQG